MTNLAKPGRSYYAPRGGLPPQTDLITDRAVFTEAYAVIPRREFSDIVASRLNTIVASGGGDMDYSAAGDLSRF